MIALATTLGRNVLAKSKAGVGTLFVTICLCTHGKLNAMLCRLLNGTFSKNTP